MIKTIAVVAGLTASAWAQSSPNVDIYSTKNLDERAKALDKKGTPFASEDLKRYGNHYTMLAYRTATGSAEVHEQEADIFVIEHGSGTLLLGGKVVEPKTTKPGEIRGSSITGGKRSSVTQGDVIHIPAGVPHQLLVDKGMPVSYFVVKVTGQEPASSHPASSN